MAKIRNKKTGEIKEVSDKELTKYGLGGNVDMAKNGKKIKMKLKKAAVGQFVPQNQPLEQDPIVTDDSGYAQPTIQQIGLQEISNTYPFNPGLTDSLMQYNKKQGYNYSPTLNPDEQTQLNDFQAKDKLNINFKNPPTIQPITGNKYFNRGFQYMNQAIKHGSNINNPKPNMSPDYNGMQGMFKNGGLMKYGNAGIVLNNGQDQHYDFNLSSQNFNQPNLNQGNGGDFAYNPSNQTQFVGDDTGQSQGIGGNQMSNIGQGIAAGVNATQGLINFGKGTLDMLGSQKQNAQVQKMQNQLYTQSVFSQGLENRPEDYIMNRNALAENGMQIKEIGGKGMPNVEVEGKEMISLPNGFSQTIQGDTHAEGGIPLSLPQGTQIFSEKLKVETPKGKKSYSQLAKPFETKKNVDMLEAKGADDIQKATADMMIKFKKDKLEQLFETQEMDKMTGMHGKVVQNEVMNDYQMKNGGLMKAATGKTLRGTGKDVENNFKDLDEVYQNYKKFGYTGAKDITQMREWSYKKDPQGVNAYITRSRPTNAHRKIWKEEYKGKGEPDLLQMDRKDVFRGYDDKLWDYRAFKFQDSPATQTPVNQPATETQEPNIQFKDRYIQTGRPDVNIDGLNIGLPMPNIYGREPLNYYKTQPNYIDNRYLNVQPQLNEISRTQRGIQNNLGSRGTGDISNLLQGQINAYNQQEQVFGNKYNYDRQNDSQVQQFNAQAKTNSDNYNQNSWYNQLESPIRQREGAIDTQQRTDNQASIENMGKQIAFNNNKNFIDKTYGQYQNLSNQDIVGQVYGSNNINSFNPNDNISTVEYRDKNGNIIKTVNKENKAYGGKVKFAIKPKIKKK